MSRIAKGSDRDFLRTALTKPVLILRCREPLVASPRYSPGLNSLVFLARELAPTSRC